MGALARITAFSYFNAEASVLASQLSRSCSMSYDEDVDRLREACTRSQKRLPLPDREAEVGATLLANGPYLDSIGNELKALLISDTPRRSTLAISANSRTPSIWSRQSAPSKRIGDKR
jgi:hypothetical protein